jgi:hypothetical protein
MSDRPKIDKYFRPEARKEETAKTYMTESGSYRLEMCRYSTVEPGSDKRTWDYSQGNVYRGDSTVPIATINRNYGSFPFAFVEGHPNGQDYLVCGEDYQGLTVVELKTGLRRDSTDKDSDKGWGFCPVDFLFNPENQVLLIRGCYWGDSYEDRIVDFTDPIAREWSRLECDLSFYEDARKPVFQDDTVTFFSTPYPTAAQENEWEKEHGEESDFDRTTLPIAASWKLRIEGSWDRKLVLIETHMTDEEKERRKRDEEG